jgi:phosphoribosyl 1,2-cyclic phosphodiesterase
VDTFLVPHDAIEPVGYVFEWGEAAERPQHRLGWLTDIGHIPPQVRQRMRGLDLLVLEANYDTKLLEADTNRPWAVKQRISGRHGHLANHDARAFLASALAEETELREVFLVHLSRDCNSTEAVANEFAPLCAEYNGRCRITTMPAGEPSAVLELS